MKDQPQTLDQIALKLKISSGGGVKSYLENLEKALFITSYVPYDKKLNSKLKNINYRSILNVIVNIQA